MHLNFSQLWRETVQLLCHIKLVQGFFNDVVEEFDCRPYKISSRSHGLTLL
jgi:hypothetical protein